MPRSCRPEDRRLESDGICDKQTNWMSRFCEGWSGIIRTLAILSGKRVRQIFSLADLDAALKGSARNGMAKMLAG